MLKLFHWMFEGNNTSKFQKYLDPEFLNNSLKTLPVATYSSVVSMIISPVIESGKSSNEEVSMYKGSLDMLEEHYWNKRSPNVLHSSRELRAGL